VSIHDPAYTIEHPAHRPLDSQITYSYEHIDVLSHKHASPCVHKLNTTIETHPLTKPLTARRPDCLANATVAHLHQQHSDVNTQPFTQTSTATSAYLRQATQAAKPLSAVSLTQENVLEDTRPLTDDEHESIQQACSNVQETVLGLERLAHVLVPVNIWSADQNEYSEHEASDFENADEAVLNLEVRKEVTCDERVKAERRVMSLSRGRVDDLSLSEADTLSSEEAYSEQELIETNQLVVLETNIKARGVDMLGLGGLESVESSAEGEEVAAMGGEEWCVEVAQETSQGFYLSLKASVSELAELNAPEEVTSEMLGDEVGEMEVRTERQMDTQVNSFEYCNIKDKHRK